MPSKPWQLKQGLAIGQWLPLAIAGSLLCAWPQASWISLLIWLGVQLIVLLVRRQGSALWPVAIASGLVAPSLSRGWEVWQGGQIWLAGAVVSAWQLLPETGRQRSLAGLGLAPLFGSLAGLAIAPNTPPIVWAVTGLWALAIALNPDPQLRLGRWRSLWGLSAGLGLTWAAWQGDFILRLGLVIGLGITAGAIEPVQIWLRSRWQQPLQRFWFFAAVIGVGLLWPISANALAPTPQALLWRCANLTLQHTSLNWSAGLGAQAMAASCIESTGITAGTDSAILQLWAEWGLMGLAAALTIWLVTGDRYWQLWGDRTLLRSQVVGGAAGLAVLTTVLPFQGDWLTSAIAPVLLGVNVAIPWARSLPSRLPLLVDGLLFVALVLQVNNLPVAAPLAWVWLVIRSIEQLTQRDFRGVGAWLITGLLFLPPLFWARLEADPSVTWIAYSLLGLGLLGATGLGRDRSLRLLRWLGLLPLIWLLFNLSAIDWTIRIGMGELYINQVGILTVMATLPALLLTWHDREWRGLYLLSSLAGAIVILGTGSRICLGALVLALGLIVLLNLRSTPWRSLLWALPGLGLAGIGLASLRPDLMARYTEIYDPARLAIARCYASQAWLDWPRSLWLGNGYGQAAAICQPPLTLNRVSHAHNFVLQILADNGVLVLAVVLIGLLLTLVRIWQQAKRSTSLDDRLVWQWLTVSLVIAIALHLFEGSFFKLPMLQLWLGLLLGLPWLGDLNRMRSPELVTPPLTGDVQPS